ncbi:MAG: hypothetical protein JST68_21530 [Bacteroidetes bacterium]|nr:hypothetical protein [Bacteroidota bacterium]
MARKVKDFYKYWLEKIKSQKWPVLIVVVAGGIGSAIVFADKVRESAGHFKNGSSPKKFTEVVGEDPKELHRDSVFSEQKLFSQHHAFFFRPPHSHDFEGEISDAISESAGDVSLSVTVQRKNCLEFNYTLLNEDFQGGFRLHKILPVATKGIDTIRRIGGFSEDYALDRSEPVDTGECFFEPGEETPPTDMDATNKVFSVPTLIFKVVNNSSDVILIEDITLNIKKSRRNEFPEMSFGEGDHFVLPLYNSGWGKATDVRLDFNIQPARDSISYSKPFKHHLSIPKVEPANANEDFPSLEPFFKAEGLNTKKLESIELDLVQDREDSVIYFLPPADAAVVGRFKKGIARIVGLISYSGKMANGQMERDSFYFNFIQDLTPPAIGGPEHDEFYARYRIGLEKTGDNYTKSISGHTTIEPKKAAFFTVPLSSGISAYHWFDIQLHYNGHQTISIPNVFLNEYVPNGVAGYMHRIKIK